MDASVDVKVDAEVASEVMHNPDEATAPEDEGKPSKEDITGVEDSSADHNGEAVSVPNNEEQSASPSAAAAQQLEAYWNRPDYATLCAFLTKFASILELPAVSFTKLNKLLECRDVSGPFCGKLLAGLLRNFKLRMTTAVDETNWQMALSKYAKRYLTAENDTDSVANFGELSVARRIELLSQLCEAQFEANAALKDQIDAFARDSLLTVPEGRDQFGSAYFYFVDEENVIRLFRTGLTGTSRPLPSGTWRHVAESALDNELEYEALHVSSLVSHELAEMARPAAVDFLEFCVTSTVRNQRERLTAQFESLYRACYCPLNATKTAESDGCFELLAQDHDELTTFLAQLRREASEPCEADKSGRSCALCQRAARYFKVKLIKPRCEPAALPPQKAPGRGRGKPPRRVAFIRKTNEASCSNDDSQSQLDASLRAEDCGAAAGDTTANLDTNGDAEQANADEKPAEAEESSFVRRSMRTRKPVEHFTVAAFTTRRRQRSSSSSHSSDSSEPCSESDDDEMPRHARAAAPAAEAAPARPARRGRKRKLNEEEEFVEWLENMQQEQERTTETERLERRYEREYRIWLSGRRPDDWLLTVPSDLEDSDHPPAGSSAQQCDIPQQNAPKTSEMPSAPLSSTQTVPREIGCHPLLPSSHQTVPRCADLENNHDRLARLCERLARGEPLTPEELRPCHMCGCCTLPQLLLICDDCGRTAYHSFCLLPPLLDPPHNYWRCPQCEQRALVERFEARLQAYASAVERRKRNRDQRLLNIEANLASLLDSGSSTKRPSTNEASHSSDPDDSDDERMRAARRRARHKPKYREVSSSDDDAPATRTPERKSAEEPAASDAAESGSDPEDPLKKKHGDDMEYEPNGSDSGEESEADSEEAVTESASDSDSGSEEWQSSRAPAARRRRKFNEVDRLRLSNRFFTDDSAGRPKRRAAQKTVSYTFAEFDATIRSAIGTNGEQPADAVQPNPDDDPDAEPDADPDGPPEPPVSGKRSKKRKRLNALDSDEDEEEAEAESDFQPSDSDLENGDDEDARFEQCPSTSDEEAHAEASLRNAHRRRADREFVVDSEEDEQSDRPYNPRGSHRRNEHKKKQQKRSPQRPHSKHSSKRSKHRESHSDDKSVSESGSESVKTESINSSDLDYAKKRKKKKLPPPRVELDDDDVRRSRRHCARVRYAEPGSESESDSETQDSPKKTVTPSPNKSKRVRRKSDASYSNASVADPADEEDEEEEEEGDENRDDMMINTVSLTSLHGRVAQAIEQRAANSAVNVDGTSLSGNPECKQIINI